MPFCSLAHPQDSRTHHRHPSYSDRAQAGQERYHSLAPMYYRGAAAAIVVYDITSPDSFARAKSWVRELQRQGNPNIVIALAGNKADLASVGPRFCCTQNPQKTLLLEQPQPSEDAPPTRCSPFPVRACPRAQERLYALP